MGAAAAVRLHSPFCSTIGLSERELVLEDAPMGFGVELCGALYADEGPFVAMLADIAVEQPVNGMLELGGPEAFAMDDLVRRYFQATGVTREVVTDEESRYYGERLQKKTLLPGTGARLGKVKLEKWIQPNAAVGAGTEK